MLLYGQVHVDGVRKPCPKPRPITSTAQPGLPDFSRSNVEKYWKAWVRGYTMQQILYGGYRGNMLIYINIYIKFDLHNDRHTVTVSGISSSNFSSLE